jgi:hypothetical protein
MRLFWAFIIGGCFFLWFPPTAKAYPYPQSTYITNWQWASLSSVVSTAGGSDNWPTTWHSNGSLYSTGGDGDPCGQSGKVSSWLGIFSGDSSGYPNTSVGCNYVRTLNNSGDGASGKKGSGLLSVNNRMYLLFRNADLNGRGCEVLESNTSNPADGFSSKFTFTEFGYCNFVNYGQNYANSPDNYVYIYSHDHPSAYTYSNRYILMRVPKDQIGTRSSYEFYAGTDNGSGGWTTNISNRGYIFTYGTSNLAQRSAMTYNAGIGRYLWYHSGYSAGTPDRRYNPDSMRIYESAYPWGPWRTAYYTSTWDMPPGESGSFPSKWFTNSGRTVYLVFSGNDAFTVRRAELTLSTSSPSPTPSRTPTPSTASPTPSRTPTPASSPTPSRTPTPGPSPTPQSGGSISNLVKYDGYDWQLMSNLQVGNAQYTDRSFTFSSLPSFLLGTQWISTANSSRSFTGEVQATFTLTQSATVYVAHNDAIFTRPSWLSSTNGWTQTQSSLTNSEPRTFTLFSRSFPQGSTVSLGPNNDTGASMYSIFVIPSTPNYSLDNDTDIDIYDILILISRFTQNLLGDFNQNGRIDIFDYNTLFKNRL